MRRPERRCLPGHDPGLEPRLALAVAPATPVVGTTITGIVDNGTTGAGVGGVPIQLVDFVGNVIRHTRTDAQGHYDFEGLKRNYYVVREAGETPNVVDATFLKGVPVDVGDVDFTTGGPFPPIEIGYKSNGTVLAAVAPGQTLLPPQASVPNELRDPAASYFEQRAAIQRKLFPTNDGLTNYNNISLITRGGILAVEGTTILVLGGI